MTAIFFRGRHFSRCMMLQSVRWYLAFGLSYRQCVGPFIEEMMQERDFDANHSTIHRWVVHYSLKLEQNFCQKKLKPLGRWRVDETYLKVKGKWKYYYHAADRNGDTIEFLLTAKRDTKVALQYLRKAIGANGKPSRNRSSGVSRRDGR